MPCAVLSLFLITAASRTPVCFAIEIKQAEAWKEVARGTTIGAEKEIVIAPFKALFVRLNVFKAERPININEFQVFAPDLKDR